MTNNNNSEYRGLKIHAIPSLHEQCMALIEGLRLPKTAKVLDLGAGEGAFSQRMVDAGLNVNAAEQDPNRFRLDIPCQNINLNHDFSDKWNEKFDLIVAMEILEHLHDPRHFISNALQVLSSDGFLLITSPNAESWLSRIRFLRDGYFLWFDENDYHSYGHLTPIFSWQIRQICRELGAQLVQVSNTKDSLLKKRLGDTWFGKLKNKSFYLRRVLYPLMKGRKDGEVNLYLIKKVTAPQESKAQNPFLCLLCLFVANYLWSFVA